MKRATRLLLLALALVVPLLVSCAYNRQVRTSANMARFLFPAGAEVKPPPVDQPVELHTPLRVGLMFVPSSTGPDYFRGPDLSGDAKVELLDRVRDAFKDRPFVKDLIVLPETFVDPTAGLAGLQRAGRAFGLDVVALVGYDQVQFSDAAAGSSVTYLTLVGAFLVPAQKNSTRTLMEASVFDLPTATLLLHAQATDSGKSRSTPVGTQAQLRRNSFDSFRSATDGLIESLDAQLDRFQEAVKAQEPIYGRQVKIASATGPASGGGGAGDLGGWGGLAALLLAAGGWAARRTG